jgi:hypothetical protein
MKTRLKALSSRKARAFLLPLVLLSIGMSAACAEVLGIDELPVYPRETGASDDRIEDSGGHDSTSERSDCDGSVPTTITFSGYSASDTEIALSFTKGPAYSLKRDVTQAHDGGKNFQLIATIPACSAAYNDDGQSGEYGVTEAGLIPNWQYSYELSPLLPNGDVDPTFGPLVLTFQTYSSPGANNFDDASVSELADEE